MNMLAIYYKPNILIYLPYIAQDSLNQERYFTNRKPSLQPNPPYYYTSIILGIYQEYIQNYLL